MSRRFGDCKDKALLLVTLLRALGTEAEPALVNTEARQAIADWLPSPLAFDHVIVRFVFQSRTYWVDATRALQRGTLAHFEDPPFARALVVREGETGLSEIPAPPPAEPASRRYGRTVPRRKLRASGEAQPASPDAPLLPSHSPTDRPADPLCSISNSLNSPIPA